MPCQTLRLTLAAALLAFPARTPAQEHQHGTMATGEKLGTVHFPTSCRAAARRRLHPRRRAPALLRLRGARRAFEAVAAKDPACGMALVGGRDDAATTRSGPPPTAAGARRRAARRRRRRRELGAATERERGYIAAIGAFYRD